METETQVHDRGDINESINIYQSERVPNRSSELALKQFTKQRSKMIDSKSYS